MNFNIPGKYLSSRARLVITPELVTGGYTRERFEPIVADAPIYARKMNRKEVLESYEDPYKDIRTSAEGFRSGFVMPYTRTVHIPEDVRTARIRAVISGPFASTHPTQILVLPASSARIMAFLPFKNFILFTLYPKYKSNSSCAGSDYNRKRQAAGTVCLYIFSENQPACFFSTRSRTLQTTAVITAATSASSTPLMATTPRMTLYSVSKPIPFAAA